MDIFTIRLDEIYIITCQINWPLILAIGAAGFLISQLVKHITHTIRKKSIIVDEVVLGIGDSSIKLKYDKKDQEIAYKLWVELNTRKIGIPFDDQDDVISEVYDSWYAFFKISRDLIKDIPANKIKHSSELIKLTTNILNEGLRPHLTRWQAKYRHWYTYALQEGKQKTPQEIQRAYPSYEALIGDLKDTNQRMIKYGELLSKIAFDVQ